MEQLIRDLWDEINRHRHCAGGSTELDLQSRFGTSGSVRSGIIGREDIGKQAESKVLDLLIGRYDDWRICCHEVGHAIVAVTLRIPLVKISRGEGTRGCVEPIHSAEDTIKDKAKFQLFLAAGAAAERIVFGTEERTFGYIVAPLESDIIQHQKLDYRKRPHGFEADICCAMRLLECGGGTGKVSEIARLLRKKRDDDGTEGAMTQEEVAQMIGIKLY